MARVLMLVPAGTPLQTCRARECAKPIFWIQTKNNRPMPIDCDVDADTRRPTRTEDGIGIPHFGSCVASKRFSHQGVKKP